MAMRMHLFAEELRDHRPVQLSLFDLGDEKSEAVANLKRRVNERFGRFVLRSGATLPLHAIYQDGTNSYDICDVRGKTCGSCGESGGKPRMPGAEPPAFVRRTPSLP